MRGIPEECHPGYAVPSVCVCGGLVPLELLLGDPEPFGPQLLCQAGSDPRLDQGGKQVEHRGEHVLRRMTPTFKAS